jgi:uncharacterized membrane protein YwzB
MIHFGINLKFLLTGLLTALLLTILYWNTQMRKYDALVKKPFVDNPIMRILFIIVTAAIMIDAYYDVQVLTSQSMFLESNVSQSMLSFVGGLLVSMWLGYFQIIYWEKKNCKTIYFDKSYGTWKKSYIVLEKNER